MRKQTWLAQQVSGVGNLHGQGPIRGQGAARRCTGIWEKAMEEPLPHLLIGWLSFLLDLIDLTCTWTGHWVDATLFVPAATSAATEGCGKERRRVLCASPSAGLRCRSTEIKSKCNLPVRICENNLSLQLLTEALPCSAGCAQPQGLRALCCKTERETSALANFRGVPNPSSQHFHMQGLIKRSLCDFWSCYRGLVPFLPPWHCWKTDKQSCVRSSDHQPSQDLQLSQGFPAGGTVTTLF